MASWHWNHLGFAPSEFNASGIQACLGFRESSYGAEKLCSCIG